MSLNHEGVACSHELPCTRATISSLMKNMASALGPENERGMERGDYLVECETNSCYSSAPRRAHVSAVPAHLPLPTARDDDLTRFYFDTA